MTITRTWALAAAAAATLAVAPAALADEPARGAVRPCTCASAQQPADASAKSPTRDARQVRSDREDHDAFLQRVWTGP